MTDVWLCTFCHVADSAVVLAAAHAHRVALSKQGIVVHTYALFKKGTMQGLRPQGGFFRVQ